MNLNPLFTMIAAFIILNESLRPIEIATIFASFGGVMLIFMSFSKTESSNKDQEEVSTALYILAVFCQLAACATTAFTYVLMRQLKSIHSAVINGFFGVFLFISASFVWLSLRVIPAWSLDYNIEGEQWMFVVLLGVFAAASNALFIMAMTSDKAGRVASLHFLQIVFGYAEDVLLFDYVLSLTEFLGGLIIVACSVSTFLFKYFKIGN